MANRFLATLNQKSLQAVAAKGWGLFLYVPSANKEMEHPRRRSLNADNSVQSPVRSNRAGEKGVPPYESLPDGVAVLFFLKADFTSWVFGLFL